MDLEDWYQVPLVNIPPHEWRECQPSVVDATLQILDFFSRFSVKATFFVSGYIADRHPHLIWDIFSAGHEVESHGYWHQLAYHQSETEFHNDIARSTVAVAQITGVQPVGYRSPAWSTTWIAERAAQVLAVEGYVYDTSLFPTSNFLYGKMDFSTDTTYLLGDTGVLEIPPSVFDIFGLKIPVTGGFYLRAYPLFLLKRMIHISNKDKPVQIYFHPWEVSRAYPHLSISPVHRIIQYYRCGTILARLEELFKEFHFGSLKQAYPRILECQEKKSTGS